MAEEITTEQNKCWLVAEGEYDDYHVVGVFTDPGALEQFMAAYKGCDNNPVIEERPLNPTPGNPVVQDGLPLFYVEMNRDGESYVTFEPEGGLAWETTPRKFTRGAQEIINGVAGAQDAQHAIEIMNERRIAYINAGCWPKT